MDNHGNAPYARVKGSLKPGGRFLMVIGDLWQMLAASRQKATISASAERFLGDRRQLPNPHVAGRAAEC